MDASVVVDLVTRFRPQALEELLWAPETVLAAPELIDIEVLNVVRKLDRAGAIPASRVAELPTQIRAFATARCHTDHSRRATRDSRARRD